MTISAPDNSDRPLNTEQQEIVDCLSGGLPVLAPVGSGKTRVLAERVRHAINKGVPADRILCLTFTNRAAQEMQQRVTQSCPEQARALTVRTFRGLCAHMLRVEARGIGLPSDFVIYDEQDSEDILAEVSRADENNPDWRKQLKSLASSISGCKARAKSDCLTLAPLPRQLFAGLDSTVARWVTEYQSILRERHALDFADLLFLTRAMLHSQQELAERWAHRFAFVQVDEVQDTHRSEFEVVSHLAINCGNLALIGDLDQTIYGWRGSEPDGVVEQFTRDIEPRVLPLQLN